MKCSKSYDNFRKKKSQQKEVKMQVFVRIRPFLKNEEDDEIRLLKDKDDNILICKYINK